MMTSKFFVVKDPTPDSTPEDFFMEFTSKEHGRYLFGCGLERYENENHVVHVDRASAVADADERISLAVAKLQALKNGPPAPRETVSIWAELRGRVSLSEVVDMVRQDLEAEVGNTDEAQSMVDRLARLIDKAQGV
jgi:hypothetical protein